MAGTRRPDGLGPLPVAPDVDSETTEVFWKTPAPVDRVEGPPRPAQHEDTELRDVRALAPSATPTQLLARPRRAADAPTEEIARPPSLPPRSRPPRRARVGPIVGLVAVSIVGFVLGAALVLLVAFG